MMCHLMTKLFVLIATLTTVASFSQGWLPKPFSASSGFLRAPIKSSEARPLRTSSKKILEMKSTSASRLREILAKPGLLTMPCCFDGLSARLIEKAGFEITFMSGFSTSAAKLGLPDTGYISYGEMIDAGRDICSAVSIPVLGDGDTGYGNPMNVKRTVRGYAQTGFASIMIEDQVAPKRCGHTKGKAVVSRSEVTRILPVSPSAFLPSKLDAL